MKSSLSPSIFLVTRGWYFLVGDEETLLEERDSSLERRLDSSEVRLSSLEEMLELEGTRLSWLEEETLGSALEEDKAEEAFPPQEIKKSNNAGEKRVERFINLILIYTLYIGCPNYTKIDKYPQIRPEAFYGRPQTYAPSSLG